MLRAITVENFKCFERLELADLGQFNLLTGRNNVGKSSLLEAIILSSGAFELDALDTVTEQRSIFPDSFYFRNIFRNYAVERPAQITIEGKVEKPEKETFSQSLIIKAKTKEEYLKLKESDNKPLIPDEIDVLPQGNQDIVGCDLLYKNGDIEQSITKVIENLERINVTNYRHGMLTRLKGPVNSDIVSADMVIMLGLGSGRFKSTTTGEYDKISKKPKFKKMALKLLNDLFPKKDLLDFTMDTNSQYLILLSNYPDEFIPLSTQGSGFKCIFHIVLKMVANPDSMFFIDEIEVGLHYSWMVSLWKSVMFAAKELDIQLFATTHSMECVRAFSEVANEKNYDARLVNLHKPDDLPHQASVYNAEALALLVEAGLELT